MKCLICKEGEYPLVSATAKLVYAMAEDAFSKGAEGEIRRFVA